MPIERSRSSGFMLPWRWPSTRGCQPSVDSSSRGSGYTLASMDSSTIRATPGERRRCLQHSRRERAYLPKSRLPLRHLKIRTGIPTRSNMLGYDNKANQRQLLPQSAQQGEAYLDRHGENQSRASARGVRLHGR